MKGRHLWRTHLPLVILILIIAALGVGVLVVDPTSKAGRWVVVLWGIVPASVAIWQYCYARIERHRLWVNRTRLWLTNPQVSWGLEAEYETADAKASFGAVLAALSTQMTKADSILSSSSSVVVAQISGLTIRLTIDEFRSPMDDVSQIVRFDVPVAVHAWRGCRDVVDSLVPRLLEDVERAVQPTTRKFVIDIGFLGDNPYFGLLIKDVPEARLVRFDIEYFERPEQTGAVTRVHRDRIQIVANSIHSGRSLSLHYLALQPVGGT